MASAFHGTALHRLRVVVEGFVAEELGAVRLEAVVVSLRSGVEVQLVAQLNLLFVVALWRSVLVVAAEVGGWLLWW